MEINGFKAFNSDRTNRYGMLFEEGKEYSISGNVSFGLKGNGFHMCSKIVDVFRYVDAIDEEVAVAKVIGSGKKQRFNDEYEGYYDMYACEKLKIVKFLTREEILAYVIKSSEFDIIKFLKTFRLNEDEIKLFLELFGNEIQIRNHILYCQCGQKDVFEKNTTVKELKKVNHCG